VDTRPVYTLRSKPAVIQCEEEALEQAKALRGRLRDQSGKGQELRRLPDETVADLLESGLCGVMKPRYYGGSELGAQTMINVTAELAAADPSAGWVYMLWTAHMWLQALWPQKAMDEMFENPNTLASSVVTTKGTAVPVDGGYRWTGRGFFSSGSDHCNWLTASVPVVADGQYLETRWLLLPREDFTIIDDWHTIGLRGTGSKTIVVDDAFVPDYRTLAKAAISSGQAPGRDVNTNPMYGGPSEANFTGAMSVPAIGAARGLIELFRQRFGDKLETPDGAGEPVLPAGAAQTMGRLARAAADVDASLALMLVDAQRMAQRPADAVGVQDELLLKRDKAFTAQQARRAANAIYEECGGHGLAESSLMQRFWRDTNAAAAHRGLTWDWQSDHWTRATLGLPVPQVT
jgi:alkylation response protein AidB-like acyl-CoA dehydrogenase